METLRHKCKIVLSIFVSLLLMVVSISASAAEGTIKTLTATLIEDQTTLTMQATVNGELPEDATLKVTKITNKDDRYETLEKVLKTQADQDHFLNNAFSIYDYAIMSQNQKIALPGEMSVTMTYSQPYAPALATNEDSVSLYRLSSQIKDLTKETTTKITMGDNSNKVTSMTYTTDTLDPIALTYREKKQTLNQIKVHYVDEKDQSKALADTQTLSASSLNGALNFDTLSKALADNDKASYTYKKTLFNNTEIEGAKIEKKEDLTHFYYVAKDSQDYIPYKGEGESFDVDLYFVYEVKEKQDTADQLVNKEKDTADELTHKQETTVKEEKDTADQLVKETNTTEEKKVEEASSKKEQDTADQLIKKTESTDKSETKDTADQLTSSDKKDTADQIASNNTDQTKDNSTAQSTSPKKVILKRAVLRAAPAADNPSEAPGTLTIVDDIANSGRIKAQYSENIPDSATDIQYTWYRTKDDTESEVKRKNTGGTYNIHYDESQATYVDVAADEGNEVWKKANGIKYKVVLTYTDQGNKYRKESSAWTLKYFGQLENGDFEKPVLDGISNYSWDSNNNHAINGYIANYSADDPDKPKDYNPGNRYSSEGIWKTTSDYRKSTKDETRSGADIEIVNTLSETWQDSYKWDGNDKGYHSSNQFAELNAESAGALYQDVLTHPGQKMNYWLAHRARRTNTSINNLWGSYSPHYLNSMYLVIAPLSEIINEQTHKPIETQSELESFIRNKCGYTAENYDQDVRYYNSSQYESDAVVYNNKGILIRKIVSTSSAWHYIQHLNEDGYLPTSSVTRFFFVAAGTASNDRTIGNFLDYVGFSQNLPEPTTDAFNLSISKTFTGLKASDLVKLAKNPANSNPFTLTVTNSNNDDQHYSKLNNVQLQFNAERTSNGYSLTPVTSKSVKQREVNVEGDATNITLNWDFTNQGIDDSTYKFKVTESNPALDGYKVRTTNAADGVGGNKALETNEILIGKNQSHSFTFTNEYTKIQKSNLTISKTVNGNQGDRTKDFKFHVVIKNVEANKIYNLEKTNVNEDKNPNALTSDENGKIDGYINLRHGASITIKDLILEDESATYNVSEVEVQGGYTTKNQIDNISQNDGSSTGTKLFGDSNSHTIAFTNTKNGEIPTGTQKNKLITLPLIIAAIGFVVYILKKKSKVE